MARPPGGRFSRPAFCERGDFFGEPTGIDNIGIEVVGEPLFEFVVAFVLWIADGLEEFGIAPGAADIFRRAAPARLDQARIKNAGLGIDEALDFDRVLPAVAKIVEVPQRLGTDILEARHRGGPCGRRAGRHPSPGPGMPHPTSRARIS